MIETWKPIAGFEGRYEVSDHGRIRGLDRPLIYKDGRKGKKAGRVLSGARSAEYVFVVLDSTTKCRVHRLVAEAFLPTTEYAETVNHINGNKHDNRACNLEWASYQRNNAHARETGLQNQHGERTNLTKFSDDLIHAARRVHARFRPSYRELGILFGMSTMHAWEIVNRTSRKRPTVDHNGRD